MAKGDPGAVSWFGRKDASKVFKHERKSPWLPTLTRPFLNGQGSAGSCLGTKNALYYCAQSAGISWFFFVCLYKRLLARGSLFGGVEGDVSRLNILISEEHAVTNIRSKDSIRGL